MEAAEIKNKVLNDESFVSSEIQKILTYYKLKFTLRWNCDSREADQKESVAEHVYGMGILCDYFLPLQSDTLDRTLVNDLILWHDMSETIVDDMTTISKTESHKVAEKEAEKTLIEKAPQQIQEKLGALFALYEAQETAEARFVKAIDKLEPIFHIRFLSQHFEYKSDEMKHKLTNEVMARYQKDRMKYIAAYPEIVRFSEVLTEEVRQSDFVHPEAGLYKN